MSEDGRTTEVDFLLTIVTLAGIAATAGLTAACFGTRTAPSYLLLTYSLIWVELVAVALLLSPIGLVSRPWLEMAVLGCLAAALVVWTVRERPRPPRFLARPVVGGRGLPVGST